MKHVSRLNKLFKFARDVNILQIELLINRYIVYYVQSRWLLPVVCYDLSLIMLCSIIGNCIHRSKLHLCLIKYHGLVARSFRLKLIRIIYVVYSYNFI